VGRLHEREGSLCDAGSKQLVGGGEGRCKAAVPNVLTPVNVPAIAA
jgi:hypothetical protein